MIKELDPVVLTTPLPEHGFRAGDVGWVLGPWRGRVIRNSGCPYEKRRRPALARY